MSCRATIRIAAVLAFCHAAFAATPPPSPAGLTVSAVKFWSLGNVTRIAIEVSGEFHYRKDRLDNPDRMFVDIAGAQPRIQGATPRGQHIIPVNDKFVKQIRVAEPKSGTTRIVLDLEPGVDCSTSQLTDPNRMLIEVTAPGRSNTPTVTPSVVVIKRFEAPPSISQQAPPPPEIKALDEAAPVVAMKPVTPTLLPGPNKRRLLASAAAPEGTPVAAKPNSSGDRSLTRVLGLKIKRVIIDAGHGGKDEGTRGPGGMTEKELVLDVAKRLGAVVEDRLGLEAVLTRDDDTFVAKERRTEIANERQGDLFISIHANSSTIRTVSGVEIYYLSVSNSKADNETAARENAGSQKTVHEMESLLQKIMLNDKLKESSEFAARILQAMVGPAATPAASASRATRSRGVRRAPFIVLIGAHMPSILAEIGFISNPVEEARMAKPAQRQKIAESLAQGIQDFAQSLGHVQQVAAQPTSRTRTTRPATAQ